MRKKYVRNEDDISAIVASMLYYDSKGNKGIQIENDLENYYMNAPERMKWDRICFVSHISGFSVQTLTFDIIKGVLSLEDGYANVKKIEISLTEELIVKVEQCFDDINIDGWAEWSYNPCADGEHWSIEVYENDELILLRTGSNAYPKGYGKWLNLYADLLMKNGIEKICTCYRQELEGFIFRKKD